MTPQHDCVQGAKNEQRINTLEKCMEAVQVDIGLIKDQLLGRPTWIVTVIITILSTLAFSSLTFALTVLKESLLK